MARPFLTARWTNLAVITYAVPPDVLAPHVPRWLTLDTLDGYGFVSLVAFEFLDARVGGVPWPGYQYFPELNLRFYVRRGRERGVVFLREHVPVRLVAWIANWVYSENYRVAPIRYDIGDRLETRTAEMQIDCGGRTSILRVQARRPRVEPREGTLEHHFLELRSGFGIGRRRQTLRFEVEHPSWEIYPVQSVHVDLDWNALYGPKWGFLRDCEPYSTVFAAGSAVRMFPKHALPRCYVEPHVRGPVLARPHFLSEDQRKPRLGEEPGFRVGVTSRCFPSG